MIKETAAMHLEQTEQLRVPFPRAFTEGVIDFDAEDEINEKKKNNKAQSSGREHTE
jgi:hypothetical protein